MMRVTWRRAAWLPVLLMAGCLPELAAECSVNAECPPERPICIAEVCTPTASSDARPGDGPPPADGIVADEGPPPDAGDAAVDRGGADACVEQGPERCDGVDDDCDGRVDEDADGQPLRRPCYTGDPSTQNRGLCRAGEAVCVDGDYGPCEGQVVPVDERCGADRGACEPLCNGEDDDCDGAVDEALALGCGPEEAVGQCVPGTRLCVGAVWQPCQGAVERADLEFCDGVDNDCDGSTDEDTIGCGCEVDDQRDCYTGDEALLGVGVCSTGFQECTPEGTYGICREQVLPGGERCDGLDNDCDGETDEELGGNRCPVGLGECRRQGTTRCNGERVICEGDPGPAVDELCNGLDDDCDGTADEGFGVGEACAEGLGDCRREGTRICTPAGQARCDARAGNPGVEGCNGQDDDCDGATDEGEDGAPMSRPCYEHEGGNPGVGACTEGAQTCAGGRWGNCEGDRPPLPEACNNADDDCDGALDEVAGGCECIVGFEEPCEYGGPVGTAGVGACRVGTRRCVDQNGVGAFTECAGEVRPTDEVCNGEDDDCDGEADEVFAEVPEVCNGADDDCDGETDEVAPVACMAGTGVCARNGMTTCVDGTPGCDAEPGQPLPEVCNGRDDDCDGVVDDGDFGTCSDGVGPCRREGPQVCEGGGLRCTAMAAPGVDEACNGIDDDCDGATDEGSFGACRVCEREGEFACFDGELVCQTIAGGQEVCNGLDDDCDNATDEQVVCPEVPHASSQCNGGRCDLSCEGEFRDRDGLTETGCERGCDAAVAGDEIDTDGLPLAIAARPDVEQFAIAWLDNAGDPWMSVDGAAPFLLGGQIGGLGLRIIGVRRGYSVLVIAPGGLIAFDVVVDRGALGINQYAGPQGPPGPVALVRGSSEGRNDEVVLVSPQPGGNDEGPILARYPRMFLMPFGPVGWQPLPNAGAGWVGQRGLVGVVIGGQPAVFGVSTAGVTGEARVYLLDDARLLTAPLPDQMAVPDVNAVVAGGAWGDTGVITVTTDVNVRRSAVYGFARADAGLGVGRRIDGALEAVQLGPLGPVVSGIDSGSLKSRVIHLAPPAAPEDVFGGWRTIVLPQGQGQGIGAAAGTVTLEGRRIIAWRDGQSDVRWAENPCQ